MKNSDDTIELQIGAPIEVKFLDDGADIGIFDGYAATFDGTDSHNDTIAPGAFTDTIAQHEAAGTRPALLWQHKMAEPVGKIIAMREDAHGLFVRGKLNLNTDAGVKAHEHLKAGDVSGLSIGYQVPTGGLENPRGGPRILKQITLHEVSIASTPSDSRARVLGVKMLTSLSELERGLRGEIQLKLPRGAAAKIAAVGWPALVGGEEDLPDPAIVAAELVAKTTFTKLATKIVAAELDLKTLNSKRR
jgi:HK97 family phage prohead protease